MATKMTLFFALLCSLLPFLVLGAPLSTDPSPLGGSDAKTNIVYCGDPTIPAFMTEGDAEDGPGFYVTNQDISGEYYFLVENSRDDHPWKYLHVPAGARRFVQVCATWQGRIIRGSPSVNIDGRIHNLGTWVESSVENGVMSGDVSFLQGCDGGASVANTDGRGDHRGCLVDMLAGAPANALANKDTGTPALKRITGDGRSQEALDWALSKCSPSEVFILEDNTHSIIDSTNGRFEVTFYKGKA